MASVLLNSSSEKCVVFPLLFVLVKLLAEAILSYHENNFLTAVSESNMRVAANDCTKMFKNALQLESLLIIISPTLSRERTLKLPQFYWIFFSIYLI